MPVKLIAVDMDGTLLDDDHVTVPARNIAALRAARDRGVKLAIASGRAWSLLAGAVEQLGGLDYALTSNGAALWDVAVGKTVYSRLMPNAQAAAIIALLHREGIPFEVYCDGRNYVRAADRLLVRRHNMAGYSEFFEAHTCFVEDLVTALAGRDVEKFNLFHVPPEARPALEAEVRATGAVELANSFGDNLEFAVGGASKGRALRALARRLGATAEETMAFGDAGNDLDMLAWAGWSFAMENGTAEAKAAAGRIAPANTAAGVGRTVEKYVLGR